MKRLLNSKISAWFNLIDEMIKGNEKIHLVSEPSKISEIVTEYNADTSILSSINNVFLESVYFAHQNLDDKACSDILHLICTYIHKLFSSTEYKLIIIALDMMPSMLLAFCCVCLQHGREQELPKRQRSSRRRSSSISPFNDSKKSHDTHPSLPISDILEATLLLLYNSDADSILNEQCFNTQNNVQGNDSINDNTIYSNTSLSLNACLFSPSILQSLYHQSTPSLSMPTYSNGSTQTIHRIHENYVNNFNSMYTKRIITNISSQNRSHLIFYFLRIYRDNICHMSSASLMTITKLISLVHPVKHQVLIPPRSGRKATTIQLDRLPTFATMVYLEMTSISYYALFNGVVNRALDALNSLRDRGSMELMTEVVLMANSIKNSLDTNPSGKPEEGPLGLNHDESEYILTSLYSMAEPAGDIVALPTSTSSSLSIQHQHQPQHSSTAQLISNNSFDNTIINEGSNDVLINKDTEDGQETEAIHITTLQQQSQDTIPHVTSPTRPRLRSIITNASFRTMKLPDDIPIIEDSNQSSNSNFKSIHSNSSNDSKLSNFKLSLKPVKTPRFKFDFKNSDRFEGIKESSNEQSAIIISNSNNQQNSNSNHSNSGGGFFGKSKKSSDDDSRTNSYKSDDTRKGCD